MGNEETKSLSPLKWLLGVVVFLVVMVGCFALGYHLRPVKQDMPAAPDPFVAVAIMAFGIVLCVLGGALYLLALATRAFTFRFDRPFFRGFGAKLWFLNLVVGLCLSAGFALVVAPTLGTALSHVLPEQIASIGGFFLPFFAAQIFLVWIQLWAPLERSIIFKRLSTMGAPPHVLAAGIPIGISDPTRNSFKKLTLIEEDLGMLWLEPNQLRYSGDSIAFTLAPNQVLTIERKADAGSTSAYFGAVHVIVHYLNEQGGESRVRFHTEGDWSLTAKARSLRKLADRLDSWKASASSASVPPPIPSHSNALNYGSINT
jgi:hypothetical protein